jgi:hypothetical protein
MNDMLNVAFHAAHSAVSAVAAKRRAAAATDASVDRSPADR